MNTKEQDLEVEEMEVPRNTLTDQWLSNPRNPKKLQIRGHSNDDFKSNNKEILPKPITPALNQIKRVSGGSSSRSTLRKTIVTFTKKSDLMPSPTTNHITFLVPNVIKERHIFASQILSLDSKSSNRLSRWILDESNIKVDNDQSHLALLKKLNESKNQHAIHNPSSKHTQDNSAYLSIISVLNMIGGGLLCSSETGADDFFIVPTGPSNAKIVQICSDALGSRHDESNCLSNKHSKKRSEEDQEENDDGCMKEPDHKKQKVIISDGNTIDTEDLRLDKRVLFKECNSDCLDWNQLKEKYVECVSSEAVSPLTFVKEMMTSVIQQEWSNKMDSTERTQPLSCSKSSCVDSIMHQLQDKHKILLSKTEISSSFSTDVELKQRERVVILQALLRIQLFGLHSEDKDQTATYLKGYAKYMGVSNSKSKKKKSSKITVEQYASDICGIIQMLAFSLSNQDSFASIVAENILLPFSTNAPSLVHHIANYFEVDLQEHENDSTSDVEIIHVKKPPTSSPATDKSRWDDVPESEIAKSPVMLLKPKEENTDTHENDIVLQNKVPLSVKNRTNHLLSSKERYCGNMFSANYIRQVTISKAKQQLKKPIKKEEKVKQEDEECVREVLATPDSRSTMTSNRRLSGFNPLLGRRLIMPTKDRIEKSRVKKDDRRANPHAKLMKAVVAMRKRR